jgi:hypothetical protein
LELILLGYQVVLINTLNHFDGCLCSARHNGSHRHLLSYARRRYSSAVDCPCAKHGRSVCTVDPCALAALTSIFLRRDRPPSVGRTGIGVILRYSSSSQQLHDVTANDAITREYQGLYMQIECSFSVILNLNPTATAKHLHSITILDFDDTLLKLYVELGIQSATLPAYA